MISKGMDDWPESKTQCFISTQWAFGATDCNQCGFALVFMTVWCFPPTVIENFLLIMLCNIYWIFTILSNWPSVSMNWFSYFSKSPHRVALNIAPLYRWANWDFEWLNKDSHLTKGQGLGQWGKNARVSVLNDYPKCLGRMAWYPMFGVKNIKHK